MDQIQDITLLAQNQSLAFRFPALGFVFDLISLTKPRIIVLLLISTCCPMILASSGQAGFLQVFWTVLGGALVSGSAGAFNCIWDRDIDLIMDRTKSRPLPAGRVGVTTAFVFATIIGILGLLVLNYLVNPFCAVIALAGHLFYVLIYTAWLKRVTTQNIVIGGAAGAVPPIVGWVAITGKVDWTAFLMFLVIFLWTPPHFWALALNRNSDFKRANIPMLPVIAGEKITHQQMLWYALSLIPTGILLVMSNKDLGLLSLIGLSSLSSIFAFKIFQLKLIAPTDTNLKTKKAWDIFGFSLIYLTLFFVFIVIDSTIL